MKDGRTVDRSTVDEMASKKELNEVAVTSLPNGLLEMKNNSRDLTVNGSQLRSLPDWLGHELTNLLEGEDSEP